MVCQGFPRFARVSVRTTKLTKVCKPVLKSFTNYFSTVFEVRIQRVPQVDKGLQKIAKALQCKACSDTAGTTKLPLKVAHGRFRLGEGERAEAWRVPAKESSLTKIAATLR